MRKFTISLACAFALCLALVGCGGSPSSPADSSPADAVQDAPASDETVDGATEDQTNDAPGDEVTDGLAEPTGEEPTLTAADLANVDVSISYGDYGGMAALSSDIQNGRMNDQVVQVDGVVSHFASGMSYSIMEPNEDGSQKIGTMFVIVGHDFQTDQDAYPMDETHVRVTGRVGIDPDGIYYLIYTLPEFVEYLD